MNKTFLGLLLLIGLSSSGQNLDNLKIQTKKMGDANYTMDFDAVADLTYPKVYESKGKSAFVAKLDTDYQNDEFRKRLQIETPVFQYSEIKNTEGKFICVITYKNPIRYFFENKLDATTGPQKANALKESAKAYETIYEPQRNSINVKRNSKLIAIADESTNNEWKFINCDDLSQREMLDLIVSENIKKGLGL